MMIILLLWLNIFHNFIFIVYFLFNNCFLEIFSLFLLLNNIYLLDYDLENGDWGLGIGPNPHSPIPHPHSPIPINNIKNFFLFYLKLNKY